MSSFKSPELILDGKITKVTDSNTDEVLLPNSGMQFLCEGAHLGGRRLETSLRQPQI